MFLKRDLDQITCSFAGICLYFSYSFFLEFFFPFSELSFIYLFIFLLWIKHCQFQCMLKKKSIIHMEYLLSSTFFQKSCDWQQARNMHVGQTLICNQVISTASVSFPLPLTQQSTSVQLHQGRLLWVTLSSGSVINNCLHPNLLPSLPFHSSLSSALPPQDGDSIKRKTPTNHLTTSLPPRHKASDIICRGTEGVRRTNVLKCITSFSTNMIIYLRRWVRCQVCEGP